MNSAKPYVEVPGVDYEERWSRGVPHRTKSIELYERIKEIDMKLFDDFFGFKSGGDGDNGEVLLYILDIVFDEDERRNEDDLPVLSETS